MNTVPLLISMTFAPLGALMAFVITYKEYSRHYPNRSKPLRLAIEFSVVTFVVIGGLVWVFSLLILKL